MRPDEYGRPTRRNLHNWVDDGTFPDYIRELKQEADCVGLMETPEADGEEMSELVAAFQSIVAGEPERDECELLFSPRTHRGISKDKLTPYLRAFQLRQQLFRKPGKEALRHALRTVL